jgi:hypothetical protein
MTPEEFAAYLEGFQDEFAEGDIALLQFELMEPLPRSALDDIHDEVAGTGATVIHVSQKGNEVTVALRKNFLPLGAVGLVLAVMLIPAGILGWKLIRMSPEEFREFLSAGVSGLLPFILMGLGALVLVISV